MIEYTKRKYKVFKKKFKLAGEVVRVNGSLVSVKNLKRVVSGEIVVFSAGVWGKVLDLDKELVKIMVFSRDVVKVGTKVVKTGSQFRVRVHEKLMGKVVNGLGQVILKDQTELNLVKGREVHEKPLGIEHRVRIDKPFHTGVAVIDLLVPLAKGQRELLVGDRTTGKSELALRAMSFQVKKGMIGVYCVIGKRKVDVMAVVARFRREKILKKCVVVAVSSSDSLGEIYEAPYTAMTIAEYFKNRGKEVLVVMDDLSTHAKFYRELALLKRDFPGRESYPGDVFYIHSSLLERGGQFKGKRGSITILPICHTTAGDLTGYISTNLMSMTDGHVYFDNELYIKGIRPAINPFVSVTRVGRQAQTGDQRKLSRNLLSLLTQFEKTERYTKFGAELSESFKQILRRGKKLWQFLREEKNLGLEIDKQTATVQEIMEGK